MTPERFLSWLPFVFPIAFAALWIGVTQLLSVIGGWRTLAGKYPVPGVVNGESFIWRTGRLGVVNYKGCLNLTASPAGLLVSVARLFSAGHRPFFVPWNDVSSETGKRWFFRYATLTFRRVPGTTLEVPLSLASAIAKASRGGLSLPP